MAATERRVGSSRRGMTVLGKVPLVPKPINLPSQRLENHGLFPDVDIVPRGTCSWGSAGRFPGASVNKSRKSDSAASNPISSGAQRENGGKVESKPVSSASSRNSGVKDGGGLREAAIQFSPPKATTVQAFDSNGKIEELRSSNSYTRNSLDSRKQETTETPLPKSGDGYVRGVTVPPGFGHCGPHVNHSRAGVSASDLQCNGVGAGMHPNTSQQNGLHSFPGVPHHNGKKEREIIVIHMVGSPGFCGNYPPQLGYPDNYSRNGSYGNFPLQFGNFEPYFGFQGHGRLDGGAQVSAVTGSDLFDEHEDYVCYEKECYHARKKNGFVRGSFQESSFLGGAQREALISRSSLKSRSTSQKHSSRNVGRLRSLYHNGRLVPIEEASDVPVPEKRITLLTKVSQHKLLTIESLEETGVGEAAHAESVVGSIFSACGDEGKAPEIFEADIVIEDAQVKKTRDSASLKMADEISLPKETELGSNEALISTTTCNDKCLHCKAEATAFEGPALMVCQGCKKTTVCESTLSTSQCRLRPTEVPVESIDKSNSTDGCAVEVKHVIFDADSCSLSTVKGQEDTSLSSPTEAAAAEKQLDTLSSSTLKKSPTQNNHEGKRKQDKKGIIDGKWKPKRPAGAAKVDFKVFAPKIRKAAGRKNTSKTFANECVSEASSSAMCNKEDSMGNVGADSIRLSSQTETCIQCQESLSPSSLYSSMDVPVDDSHESAKEKPEGAAFVFVDCIASEGRVQKKKGKNTRKATLHKDCHDNGTHVESLVKTVFEDISSTEVQEQEPKGPDSTSEKAWRPKVPTVLQSKSATKASGVRVSKAHVVPRKRGLQGSQSHSVFGSTFSAESFDAAEGEENAVQKSSSPSTSQLCNSEVLKTNKTQSFKAPLKNCAGGQQSLVFRKRSAEQAALGHQSSRDTSSYKQPIGSLAASSKGEFGLEHTKQSVYSTSSCQNNLADMNFCVSASKYHMIRRRVYHVVEGTGGDYFVPFTRKSHQRGNHRSLQTTMMQNQKQFRKKTVFLSSGSSCTESEHSEEFSDSMCMVEIKSCISQSKGTPHSGQAGVAANNQPTSGSLISASGSEESKAKKHVRPGERFSAWRPKAAPESGTLENIFQKKDNNKSGKLIPTPVEGASKEIKDSASSSHVSASSHLDAGENNEEHTTENLCGLPLELETVCHQRLEEINPPLNQEDALPSIENKEVVDSQKLSEIVASMEEMEHGSVLKHVEEVTLLESLGPVRSFEVVQQTTQTCSQENTDGNHIPFFKKKNGMSYEKANQYHQIMFKKYKQTGHWKPKS